MVPFAPSLTFPRIGAHFLSFPEWYDPLSPPFVASDAWFPCVNHSCLCFAFLISLEDFLDFMPWIGIGLYIDMIFVSCFSVYLAVRFGTTWAWGRFSISFQARIHGFDLDSVVNCCKSWIWHRCFTNWCIRLEYFADQSLLLFFRTRKNLSWRHDSDFFNIPS